MIGLRNWLATFLGGCLLLMVGDALFGGISGTGFAQAALGAASVATGLYFAPLVLGHERQPDADSRAAEQQASRRHVISMTVFSVAALLTLAVFRLAFGSHSSEVVATSIAAVAGVIAAHRLPRHSRRSAVERS